MFPSKLLTIAICVLTASSIVATPLLSGQTEGSTIHGRDVHTRDVLPLQDAIAQFTTNISAIRASLDAIGSANVSSADAAKKATDDLKISYDNFYANLEALKSAKSQAKVSGLFSSCGVIKDISGIIENVLVLVNIIKSAIGGEPIDANDIITAVFTTLSIIVQGVPTLLTLVLSICLPF